ncbi:Ger(x)C family spore germination protein [Aquibacillus saliphilus]|uniref:Ger(x)C family spore germination protein n=1 Tax=Aquibacillus saliphilus TaxID=1909422 RepID=UPI001CF092C2|nr:Ger(x)C family spore germination protein [Aquibacillus saliphilus]
MKIVLPILCMATLLIGCVDTKQIEQLGIITSYGADLLEDDLINNTLLYTQFDPDIKEPIQLVESKSNSYEGAVDAANLKTNYKLVTGQLRLKVFGKELAKQGIVRLLTTHYRDAEEPSRLYVVVSDTTAKDVLTINTSFNLSKFLYNLIDNNRKLEILPKSDFKDFAHKYADIGIDPIQPLITIEKKKPIIERLALFQNDVFVGSLTTEETFLFKLVMENFKAVTQEITIPKQPFEEFIKKHEDKRDAENLHVILSELRSGQKITLEDTKNLKYNVDIKIDANLLEISEQVVIEDEKVLNKMEEQISKKINKKLEEMLDKLKELNVDTIGFGRIYNQETKHKELTEQKWRELYPTIDVTFNVDVNILRHGVFD